MCFYDYFNDYERYIGIICVWFFILKLYKGAHTSNDSNAFMTLARYSFVVWLIWKIYLVQNDNLYLLKTLF